ncbi:hypothetical protein OGAPHI_004346 [Ogataea philodendri]|uniref:Nudix hydrolase domain-containing protein n=1 Tax=Ogataea philodendri TaxID=1378263 RepID=A0A9P8P6G1_9ASCO|nr:uncharacterized protein OGAPHI_004346 [Ogataea philodendri]KAH3666157.1 hypothetical protein OGAPHI_004346 [Ogataea philodendri]
MFSWLCREILFPTRQCIPVWTGLMTFLPQIEQLDVVLYPSDKDYAAFREAVYVLLSHDGTFQIGYLLPIVVEKLATTKLVTVDTTARTVQLAQELTTLEQRNTALNELASYWRKKDYFSTLRGWRDELYTIYSPDKQPYILLERAACPLLGVVMYGVHINGYVKTAGEVKLWIPRRSATKQTFPGMLDNTVAGGLGYPHGPFETCVKECYEEAGLPEEFVRQNLKPAGQVSYFYQAEAGNYSSEAGLLQPELQYVYDLEMSAELVPKPVDNEAEDFQLLDIPQVCELIRAGKFKPNCAGVIVDFLMRHGYLTAENEQNMDTIHAKLHRKLPFPIR